MPQEWYQIPNGSELHDSIIRALLKSCGVLSEKWNGFDSYARDPELKRLLESRQEMIVRRFLNGEAVRGAASESLIVLAAIMVRQGALMSSATRRTLADACETDSLSRLYVEREACVNAVRSAVLSSNGVCSNADPDWSKYGMDESDFENARHSKKFLSLARDMICDRLGRAAWFAGTSYAFDKSGFSVLVLVRRENMEDDKKMSDIIHGGHVQETVFGMPVLMSFDAS